MGFYFSLTEQRCCWLYRSENENTEVTNLKDPGFYKESIQVVNWNALEYASRCESLRSPFGTEFQFTANFCFFFSSVLDLYSPYLLMEAMKSLEHCSMHPNSDELFLNLSWYLHLHISRGTKTWKEKITGTHILCSICKKSLQIMDWCVSISIYFLNDSLTLILAPITNTNKWVQCSHWMWHQSCKIMKK